jgi:hypothetical protein
MSDHDLDERLSALADHAQRTGTLGAASDVRSRGDRRRRNQHATSAVLGVVLLGALGGGIALGQQHRDPNRTTPVATAPTVVAPARTTAVPTASPSATAPSTVATPATGTARPDPTTAPTGGATSKPATGSGIPSDKRQVYVQADGSVNDKVLSAGVDGEVGGYPLGGDAGETELFHLAGIASPYSLQTVRLTGGEPSCLTIKNAKLIAGACDADLTTQDVTLTPAGRNADGKALFVIVIGGWTVGLADDDTVTVRKGGTATTKFFFVDGGAYQGPFD